MSTEQHMSTEQQHSTSEPALCELCSEELEEWEERDRAHLECTRELIIGGARADLERIEERGRV